MNREQCRQLGRTLGLHEFDSEVENGVCSLDGARRLGPVVFQPSQRRIRSHMVHTVEFSAEPGFSEFEITLLDVEVMPLVRELSRFAGIWIGSLHNHEILIDPPVKYLHVVTDRPPKQFARLLHTCLARAINPISHRTLLSTLS